MNQKYPQMSRYSKLSISCFLLLVEIFVFPIGIEAQGIKAKEMKRVLSDLSASTHQRLDSTGIPCGLIKVLSNAHIADFGKSVVGDVNSKMNEYWVYMPQKSKAITIKRENYLPVTIKFADYGIEEIESKMTYQLTLKESSLNQEKNCVIINIKPQHASLSIDNIDIDVQKLGNYRLILDKGEHICRVEANGYKPSISIINAGRGLQTLDIEMESLMASVDVVCGTSTSEIYINNELKGKGNWTGMLPAGEYNVEARLDGYVSCSQKISVNEKETKIIRLPQLQRDIISLIVKTVPEDCCMRRIYIDGHLLCTDSLCKIEVNSGKHELKVEAVGCLPKIQTIDVGGRRSDSILVELVYTNINYQNAYKGDVDAQLKLGSKANFEWECGRDKDMNFSLADYWFTNAIHNPNASKSIWLGDTNNQSGVIRFLSRKGNKNELLAFAKILEEESCEFTNVHINIAECYEIAKEYEKSIEHYKKYCDLEKFDDNSDIFSRIGMCYHYLKNDEQAKKYLLKANMPESLGDFYSDIGNRQQAINWYRKRLDQIISGGAGYLVKDFVNKMKERGLYDDVVKGRKIPVSLLNGKG